MTSDVALEKQINKLGWVIGSGVTLAILGLYIWTLAPTVLEADAGEFQFVPWLPGIAHPTGYPLYILLGWLWTHLFPVGEVAWRMNLLSAIFATMAVGLTFVVARHLLEITLPDTPAVARLITAGVVSTTFAVTETFWSQAIIAEVYALHALFVVAILWLVLKIRGQSNLSNAKQWSGKLLAVTFGFGLTHHVTTILLSPAVLVFLWTRRRLFFYKAVDEFLDKPTILKQLLIYGTLSFAPLLLYLYLPLVAASTPYAMLSLSDTESLTLYGNSFRGFLDHVTGSVFAGQLQPAAVGIERVGLVWQLLREQVGWVGVVLAGLGVITMWQRRCYDLLLLTSLLFLAYVIFNLIYFIGDVFVLFIPAWLIVCLWLGVGGLGLSHWIATNFVRYKMSPGQYIVFTGMQRQLGQRLQQIVTSGISLLFFVLPVTLTITQFSKINQSDNYATTARWQEILAEPIPESAILLSNDRNEIMPMWYYQYVEGHRPDLLGLFPLIVPDERYSNIGRVLDQALASERPVYFIKPMDGLALKADITPKGTLFQATANNVQPSHLSNITLPEIIVSSPAGNDVKETVMLLGYDLSSAKVVPGDEITVTLHWQTVQVLAIDYTSYVHLVTEDGQGIAQSDHRPGGDIYSSSYWHVGEVLRDSHTFSVPSNLPGGIYQLRVGMYYQPQPGVIAGMGDGTEIGTIAIRVAIDDNTKQS